MWPVIPLHITVSKRQCLILDGWPFFSILGLVGMEPVENPVLAEPDTLTALLAAIVSSQVVE